MASLGGLQSLRIVMKSLPDSFQNEILHTEIFSFSLNHLLPQPGSSLVEIVLKI